MSNQVFDWSDEECNQSLLTAIMGTEEATSNQSDDEPLTLLLRHGLSKNNDTHIDNDSDDECLAAIQQRLKEPANNHTQIAETLAAKSRLAELLKSNGLQIRPVAADGDCLFSAVLIQMAELQSNVDEIRHTVCDHIVTNKAIYTPFLDDSQGSFADQVELLRKKGHWNSQLGDIVPTALANMLQVNILIFSSNESFPITPVTPSLGSVIKKDLAVARLAIPGQEHFDAVMPIPLSEQSQPAQCVHIMSDLPPTQRVATSVSPRSQAQYISPIKREKTRKRGKREESWKKNIRKKLRLSGKEYTDSRGKMQSAKIVSAVDCSKCRFKCQGKFSEEDRQHIFKEYYDIDSAERKQDYLCARIHQGEVARKIANKKSLSRQYFLDIGHKHERVCQAFFLKTLDISHKSVSGALFKKTEGNLYTNKDKRGRHAPHNKTPESTMQQIYDHINSFPTLNPHYVRKDTSRKFLEQDLTIRRMHSLYQEENKSQPQKLVREKVYRNVFNTKFNLSFHVPKKDQCFTCNQFKENQPASQEDERKFEEHIQRKTIARTEKNKDKESAKTDPNFESATFDLQAILPTPCGLVSQLYYKRKLRSYNLSFFQQSNAQGICYLWDETHGCKESSEIATCLCLYLNTLRHPITSVSLFSDTCGGQNKNKNVCAALLKCVNHHPSLKIIDQKFFEPGHSCMESDSMHSAIETAKRKTRVHVPSQWDTVIRLARRKKPYLVNPLRHCDFDDYKSLGENNMFSASKMDKNGKKVNFRSIVWFRYVKSSNDTVFFKTSMDDAEFNHFNVTRQTRKKSGGFALVPKKYKSKLPISAAKKKDLLDLCRSCVIPEDFHVYYEGLLTSKTKTDRLEEPDVMEQSDNEI